MTPACKTRLAAVFWAFFLMGIASPGAWANPVSLNDEPVPGWPALQIETRFVAQVALRGYCFQVPVGAPNPDISLDSCVRPDFWRGVCDIFIDVAHILSAELRGREEKRCRGYDHRGSDFLAEALRAWRERGENRYADMLDFESVMFVWEPLTK